MLNKTNLHKNGSRVTIRLATKDVAKVAAYIKLFYPGNYNLSWTVVEPNSYPY